jgi:hypothetical protein
MASSSQTTGLLRLLGLLNALRWGFSDASRISGDLFTTNMVCSPKHCINPLFPALEELGRLEKKKWVCQDRHKMLFQMNFCRDAVHWPASLIVPDDEEGETVSALVKKQEQMAITMYAYHLSGMGFEHWDHTRPWEEVDPCILSIWRAVCWTYFPQQELNCKAGQETKYLRPCKDTCTNYIKACGVECCDESVQCVFEHTAYVNKSTKVASSGYIDHLSPSQKCTGGIQKEYGLKQKVYDFLYDFFSNMIPVFSFVGMGVFSYWSIYTGKAKDRLYS